MTEQTLDLQDTMPRTAIERPTTMRAIRRYWYLVLVCAVLGAGCGAVYAFKRPQVYTASARLSAISVNDANSASLAGSLEAAQELASTFARDRPEFAGHTGGGHGAAHNARVGLRARERDADPEQPLRQSRRNRLKARDRHRRGERSAQGAHRYARKLVTLQAGSPSLLASIGADAVQLSHAQAALARLKAQSQGLRRVRPGRR